MSATEIIERIDRLIAHVQQLQENGSTFTDLVKVQAELDQLKQEAAKTWQVEAGNGYQH